MLSDTPHLFVMTNSTYAYHFNHDFHNSRVFNEFECQTRARCDDR